MGCGCGQPARQWVPASEAPKPADAEGDEQQLDPNERIQQRLREQATQRTWPGTWQGRAHTPAGA